MYFNNALPPNSYYGDVSLDYNRQDSCGSSPPAYMIRSRDYLNNNPNVMKDLVTRISNGESVQFPCAPGDGQCPGSFIMRDVPTATLKAKKLTWVLLLTGPNVNGPFQAHVYFIFFVPEGEANPVISGYFAPDVTNPIPLNTHFVWAVF
ncbi:hypothetical protein [Bacillus thuringiensis]|uniref:hypothetical protein n=1 Tax=Bacillus thuringiensis TaxID=1428 RepID=UPI000BFD8A27|nr:hypothetical protein [Bacillus thuringiensis]PGU35155.1 hypothetical protein COD63_29785 [Bacillus thuringiensis]